MTPEERRETLDFWEGIIYDPDGKLDEQQVLLELYDYQHLIEHASKVYWSITDGALSKPTYHAKTVLAVHEDCIDKLIKESVIEALKRVEAGEDVQEVLDEYI